MYYKFSRPGSGSSSSSNIGYGSDGDAVIISSSSEDESENFIWSFFKAIGQVLLFILEMSR